MVTSTKKKDLRLKSVYHLSIFSKILSQKSQTKFLMPQGIAVQAQKILGGQ